MDDAGRSVLYVLPEQRKCTHVFAGWRNHYDPNGVLTGGEQVCKKCGIGIKE
jgi:hypothetical protein